MSTYLYRCVDCGYEPWHDLTGTGSVLEDLAVSEPAIVHAESLCSGTFKRVYDALLLGRRTTMTSGDIDRFSCGHF
jgi:hypothetical protein